jgi:hypothetical protein
VAASLTSGRPARDRPRLRRGPAAFQLLVALVCAGFGYASDSWAQGRFDIRSAYVERAEGVYQLNATLDFDIGEGARAAVRDGAPFTLNLEIVVRRAGLDVHTMPDTLRFILFWSDDWRQRSEWYTWSPRL